MPVTGFLLPVMATGSRHWKLTQVELCEEPSSSAPLLPCLWGFCCLGGRAHGNGQWQVEEVPTHLTWSEAQRGKGREK